MARKRSKSRGSKPRNRKSEQSRVDPSMPQTAAENSQVDQQALLDQKTRNSNPAFPSLIIEANSITEAVQKAASEQALAVISNLPTKTVPPEPAEELPSESLPTSELDSPAPIPVDTIVPGAIATNHSTIIAEDEDVMLEILSEELDDEEAAKFVHAMAVEEMVEDVFANFPGPSTVLSEVAQSAASANKPASEKPPIPQAQTSPTPSPQASTDGFDINLADFGDDESLSFDVPQSPQTLASPTMALPPHRAVITVTHAPTIIPPPDCAILEEDIDLEQTGDYTEAAERLWEFLNSPAADKYHNAQLRFEKTKDITDKPDLDTMVRDFHRRKGGGGIKR